MVTVAVSAYLIRNLHQVSRELAPLVAEQTDQLSLVSRTVGALAELTDVRREQFDELARSVLEYAPRFDRLVRRIQILQQELQVLDARLCAWRDADSTAAGANDEPDSDREQLLADAQRLIEAGDSIQAERTLELLLQRWPADPPASLMLAQLTVARNPEDYSSLKRAAVLAGTALSEPTLSAAAHAILGEVARNFGDAGTSETEYRRAVSLSPGTPVYNRDLAFVLCAENRWHEAVQQLERVIASTGGGDEEVRYARALALAKIGNLRRAAEAFAELATENPTLAGAAAKAGEMFAACGEHREAAGWYRKACAARTSWKLSQSSGREELSAGNGSAAVEELENAERLLADTTTRSRTEEESVLRDLLTAYSLTENQVLAARTAKRLAELQSGDESEGQLLQ